ncbi:MAG: ankyrin repeat domain-containing protein [Planctomycetes bacterium]|nr:ankyrin repeat domain-containing protein [Planctomycetota bacterium]
MIKLIAPLLFIVLFFCSCGKKEEPVPFVQEANNPLIKEGKWSLLHELALGGNTYEVREIMIKKVNPNVVAFAKDQHKVTPLHLAAAGGHKEICELLLENNADINSRDTIGNTPLHKAIEANSLDSVKLLVEKGADLEAQSFYVYKAVDLAEEKKHKEVASYLQEVIKKAD